jgi:hypothetical protein
MTPALALQLISVATFFLWIANVVWAFRDARRRGRSGILIGALVGFTFPLGVALWILARPRAEDFADADEESDADLQPPANDKETDRAGEDPDAKLKQRANAGTL